MAGLSEQHNEQLFFHGSSEEAYAGIAETGFLKSFQTSAAGQWQRFGTGFYFALHASKSHDYPLEEMKRQPEGEATRRMLLCKVAKGVVHRTESNMDYLAAAPDGCHSVHGMASKDGPMNFDEVVVYEEAAILPWALVEYRFKKLPRHRWKARSLEVEPKPNPHADPVPVDSFFAFLGRRLNTSLSCFLAFLGLAAIVFVAVIPSISGIEISINTTS